MKSSTSGIVEFEVTTDLDNNLLPIAQIALSWHSSATHWEVYPAPHFGRPNILRLYNHPVKDSHPLPYPLNSPELLANFIENWLANSAEYGHPEWDGDGHNVEGALLTTNPVTREGEVYDNNRYNTVINVIPTHVYYGK